MDLHPFRQQLDDERRWVEDRGGQTWVETYVGPFYLEMMGRGPADDAVLDDLLPQVRARAFELPVADIATMLSMAQWRIQVMGTWYAVARSEASLSAPAHRGLEHCHGRLTAPGLVAAVLTYRSEHTVTALRAYRERDLTQRLGAAGIAAAALHRLDAAEPHETFGPQDDAVVDHVLAVARRLRPGSGQRSDSS